MKIEGCVFIASLVILIVAPERDTLRQMILLKYLTPDNINYLGGNMQAAIDYIIEQMQMLK